MKLFDLRFSDGKGCRCIVLEESGSDAEEERQLRSKFGDDRVVNVTRIKPAAPSKLPWVRQSPGLWIIGLFALSRLPSGEFHCFWPGGEVTGDKDLISSTVRQHWHLHS